MKNHLKVLRVFCSLFIFKLLCKTNKLFYQLQQFLPLLSTFFHDIKNVGNMRRSNQKKEKNLEKVLLCNLEHVLQWLLSNSRKLLMDKTHWDTVLYLLIGHDKNRGLLKTGEQSPSVNIRTNLGDYCIKVAGVKEVSFDCCEEADYMKKNEYDVSRKILFLRMNTYISRCVNIKKNW